MTSMALHHESQGSRYRALGWGTSALLHGGALAFFLYGMPHPAPPPPAPEIIPLQMAAVPSAPLSRTGDAAPAMEEAQVVAPQATTAAQVPPPPSAVVAPEAAAVAAPPPEALVPPAAEPAATPPLETVQVVEPETQRASEPDTLPLEAVDIPPPPPAPPPPPVQARPPEPAPPRPAPPRREAMRPAPTAAPVETQALSRSAPQAAATAAPPPASAPSAAPSEAVTAPPRQYLTEVFAALRRATRYPQRARLRRIEGVATVLITMRRDGTVTRWTVVRGTGNADLDEAAGEAIERASPLPAPPAGIGGDPVSLQMPISFTLR